MQTIFDMAKVEDRDEALEFANYVFSHDYDPRDFGPMLPKIFRRENFMDGMHYLAREGGKIVSMVGAYPLEMRIACGKGGFVPLPGRSVGMVCTHPQARGRGLMTALLKTAMADMAREGIAFACLSEESERYGRFGFAPGQIVHTFSCDGEGIARALGGDWKTGLSLEQVGERDGARGGALLDGIHALHEAKPARMKRERAKLHDILSSWEQQAFALTEGGRVEGYMLYNQYGNSISEIALKDISRLPEAIGLFLREHGRGDVEIVVHAHEPEKIARLSAFCEKRGVDCGDQFAILDCARVVGALVGLKAAQTRPSAGSFTFEVEDERLGLASKTRIFVGADGAGAEKAGAGEKAALKMGATEAARFLFAPASEAPHRELRESAFLRDILPLPISWETADGV